MGLGDFKKYRRRVLLDSDVKKKLEFTERHTRG